MALHDFDPGINPPIATGTDGAKEAVARGVMAFGDGLADPRVKPPRTAMTGAQRQYQGKFASTPHQS